MAKAIQWISTCYNCKTTFFVHVKEEEFPDEPVIIITCPNCSKTWQTEITMSLMRAVCYAK